MTHIATYTYDEGTSGNAITAGLNGIVSVSGTATYQTSAAIHRANGAALSAGAGIVYGVTSDHSGSIYQSVTTVGTGDTAAFIIRGGAGVTLASVQFVNSGNTFAIKDSGGATADTSAATWATNDVVRFDWQCDYSAGGPSIDLTVRLFIDGNSEGTTPDETINATISVGNSPNQVSVGISGVGSGWTTEADTFSLHNTLTWIGPYIPNPNPPSGLIGTWTSTTGGSSAFIGSFSLTITSAIVPGTFLTLLSVVSSEADDPTTISSDPRNNSWIKHSSEYLNVTFVQSTWTCIVQQAYAAGDVLTISMPATNIRWTMLLAAFDDVTVNTPDASLVATGQSASLDSGTSSAPSNSGRHLVLGVAAHSGAPSPGFAVLSASWNTAATVSTTVNDQDRHGKLYYKYIDVSLTQRFRSVMSATHNWSAGVFAFQASTGPVATFPRYLGSNSSSSTSSFTHTVTQNVAASRLVIVGVVAVRNSTPTRYTVSDSKGNYYYYDSQAQHTGGTTGQYTALYRSLLNTSLVAGDTITVTAGSSQTAWASMSIELDGMKRTPDENVITAGVTTADSTPLPGSKTTNLAGDQLISAVAWQTGPNVLTRPGGWSGTNAQRTGGNYTSLGAVAFMWKTGGAPGSESANGGSFNANTTWSSVYEAYRAMPTGQRTAIGGVKKTSEIDAIVESGVRKTVRGHYVIVGGVKKRVD